MSLLVLLSSCHSRCCYCCCWCRCCEGKSVKQIKTNKQTQKHADAWRQVSSLSVSLTFNHDGFRAPTRHCMDPHQNRVHGGGEVVPSTVNYGTTLPTPMIWMTQSMGHMTIKTKYMRSPCPMRVLHRSNRPEASNGHRRPSAHTRLNV